MTESNVPDDAKPLLSVSDQLMTEFIAEVLQDDLLKDAAEKLEEILLGGSPVTEAQLRLVLSNESTVA